MFTPFENVSHTNIFSVFFEKTLILFSLNPQTFIKIDEINFIG